MRLFKIEKGTTLLEFLQMKSWFSDISQNKIGYFIAANFNLITEDGQENLYWIEDEFSHLAPDQYEELKSKLNKMKNKEVVESILNSYAETKKMDNWNELIGHCNNDPEEIAAHYEMAMDRYISEQKPVEIENKIQIGKWYKEPSSEYLVCVTNILGKHNYVEVYGFGSNGNWFSKWDTVVHQLCVEATTQEVEKALIEEAKRKGHNYKRFGYNPEENELCGMNNGRLESVFCNGHWEQPIDKFSELKEAHMNGAIVQFRGPATMYTWYDCHKNHDFMHDYEYRIKPEALRKITLNRVSTTEEELKKAFADSGVLLIDESVDIEASKFIKGQWYTHTEPGQEKFLIRVEDLEKQICSGWDCKGNPFKNEWVHLGNRLVLKTKNPDHVQTINEIFESNFK